MRMTPAQACTTGRHMEPLQAHCCTVTTCGRLDPRPPWSALARRGGGWPDAAHLSMQPATCVACPLASGLPLQDRGGSQARHAAGRTEMPGGAPYCGWSGRPCARCLPRRAPATAARRPLEVEGDAPARCTSSQAAFCSTLPCTLLKEQRRHRRRPQRSRRRPRG